MAISYINSATNGGNTVAIPAHQVNDLIIICAYRNATTAPTVPAGFTSIVSSSGNSNSIVAGYRFATATDTTSGTWTNSNVTQAVVYRGVTSVGYNAATNKAASTTVNIPTITVLNDGVSDSQVLVFAGSRQTGASSTPADTTLRVSGTGTTARLIAADTNGNVTAWAAHTSTISSAVSAGISINLRSTPPGYPRRAIATGNWNNPMTWFDARAGSLAGSPIPSDIDPVEITANYIITLTSNAECSLLTHSNGTLNTSSYNLTIGGGLDSYGSTARTITFGSGTITVHQNHPFTGGRPFFSGSNLTFNAGTSLLVINAFQLSPESFGTLSKTFNDVRINLSHGTSGVTLSITGSPTFRLLDIRSASDHAHTVNVSGDMSLNKFIAIGSSSSNRLKFTSGGNNMVTFTSGGSCYGQYIDTGVDVPMGSGIIAQGAGVPKYIGSSSIGGASWLTQDPPNIHTFIDPLTTAPASNTNWTPATYGGVTAPTLTTTSMRGGGYRFDSTDGIISTDTYNIINSELIIEVPPTEATKSDRLTVFVGWANNGALTFATMGSDLIIVGTSLGFGLDINRYGNTISSVFTPRYTTNDAGTGSPYVGWCDPATTITTLPTTESKFIKFSFDATESKFKAYLFNDGAWELAATSTTYDSIELLKSSRIYITKSGNAANAADIGSINMPNLPPVVALNTPDATVFNTATPTLEFTGTDSDNEDITYEVALSSQTQSTGSILAGLGTNDDTVGTLQWYNPNAVTNDIPYDVSDIFGQPTSSGISNYLKTSNFGFSIPTGAIITGIEAVIYKYTWLTPTVIDNEVRLVRSNGSFGSQNKAMVGSWPDSIGDSFVYGSPTDLWGEAWTAEDINSNNFGVAISADITFTTNSQANIQDIHITVYYTTISPIIALSATDPGFTNEDTPADTDPFNSGDKISYTTQELPDGTYSWRVRGKDPDGSNEWGDWSETRTFIISLIISNINTWTGSIWRPIQVWNGTSWI